MDSKGFTCWLKAYKQVNVIYDIVSIKSMVTYEKFEHVWTLRQAHKWIGPIRNEMDSRFYYCYFLNICTFFLSNELNLST